MPFQNTVFSQQGASVPGQRVKEPRIVDVLPIEVESIGLAVTHHPVIASMKKAMFSPVADPEASP